MFTGEKWTLRIRASRGQQLYYHHVSSGALGGRNMLMLTARESRNVRLATLTRIVE